MSTQERTSHFWRERKEEEVEKKANNTKHISIYLELEKEKVVQNFIN